MLGAGFHPPLAEGFSRFIASTSVARAVSDSIDQELKEGKSNPYDTHPPLRERIAAAESFPPRAQPTPDPPAISLLHNFRNSRLVCCWHSPMKLGLGR